MPSIVRYLDIIPQQEPFDMSLDAKGRQRYGFNILVRRHPKVTASQVIVGDEVSVVLTPQGTLDRFIEELVTVLVAAAVGVLNTTIFVTGNHRVPAKGDGPYLSIVETSGFTRLRTHDFEYSQPAAQIVARATIPADARAMAWDAYSALVNIQNADVTTA